jgi:hypothetical protein
MPKNKLVLSPALYRFMIFLVLIFLVIMNFNLGYSEILRRKNEFAPELAWVCFINFENEDEFDDN